MLNLKWEIIEAQQNHQVDEASLLRSSSLAPIVVVLFNSSLSLLTIVPHLAGAVLVRSRPMQESFGLGVRISFPEKIPKYPKYPKSPDEGIVAEISSLKFVQKKVE
jgi:hypothetical protein